MLQQKTNSMLDSMILRAAVDRWRSIRAVSSPAFSSGKLRKIYALIQNCAMITSNHLKEAAERNEDIDLKKPFGHYSLDVMARCAFGTRCYSHTDSSNEFVTEINKAASARRMSWKVIVAMLFPGLSKYFGLSTLTDDDLEYFRKVCQCIMNERRQSGHRHDDFLQLIMDTQEGNLASNEDGIVKPENRLFGLGSGTKQVSADSNKRLSEVEAMAQCVFSLLAGQATSTSVITFTVYLLALNPRVQEKLRNEVDECTEANGLKPSMDVISKLKYLHCVASEGLRMFPLAARIVRCSYDDYVLGDTGIKLPKGCPILIPLYAIHHDPEFFSDPESFNPERFSDGNMESIRPYTYLPFGAGPRNCLGMRFALLSIKLCLFHAVRSVQFTRTEKTKVPLRIKKGIGLMTAEDITVGIHKRPDRLV
ncbi:cytochrome P450 3A21-like [Dermacentor variabilis]|uniref:cytochrome P450 3A21-like n=1 Tax=Dermacentor variabilis TaxID=34621 RepID=UPI003F5BE500